MLSSIIQTLLFFFLIKILPNMIEHEKKSKNTKIYGFFYTEIKPIFFYCIQSKYISFFTEMVLLKEKGRVEDWTKKKKDLS